MPTQNKFSALLSFLDALNASGFYYRLRYTLPRAISVDVDFPGARWEVDFHESRNIELEVFKSDGGVERKNLDELLTMLDEESTENEGQGAI